MNPNHAKQVKRECNRFRKQADRRSPGERHHLYELIAEVEWLLTEVLVKPEQATAKGCPK